METIPIPYKLNGKIVGEEQVKKILESAPQIVKTYMRKYMRYAGNTFIGSKKKDGAVRAALAEKRKPNGQPWARKFINAAANFRIDEATMTMRAGVIYTNQKPIHEIMELLESGKDSTSQDYRIIANREKTSYVNNAEAIKAFHRMLNSKELTFVFENNKILYFDKQTKALAFIGVKHTRVSKKWDFDKAINTVYGKVEKRASKVLDSAVADIEKQNYTMKDIED